MVAKTLTISRDSKNVEDIFDGIGGFGRFQVCILVALLMFEVPAAFTIFSPIISGLIILNSH